MIKTTRAQREALREVFHRGPLVSTQRGLRSPETGERPLTYRQFRRQVHPGFGCILLHWQGMWLGIEKDGYTHS